MFHLPCCCTRCNCLICWRVSAYACLRCVVVFQLLCGQAAIYPDCGNVVDDHACPEDVVRRGGLHAGTVRSTLAADRSLASVAKVKAHRDLDEIAARAPDSHELFLAVGNDHADKAVKRAQELHPQPSRQDRDDLANGLSWLQMALRVFAATLTLFPAAKPSLRKECRDSSARRQTTSGRGSLTCGRAPGVGCRYRL